MNEQTILLAIVTIAIVLLLALYFKKRSKKQMTRHMVRQILAQKDLLDDTSLQNFLNKTSPKVIHSKKEVQNENIRINPLTQLPIVIGGKKVKTEEKRHEANAQAQIQKQTEHSDWHLVTLFENTPERVNGVKVLITLIREDSDGKLRASLSYYEKSGSEIDFRVARGDVIKINGASAKIEEIIYAENNRGKVKIRIKSEAKK